MNRILTAAALAVALFCSPVYAQTTTAEPVVTTTDTAGTPAVVVPAGTDTVVVSDNSVVTIPYGQYIADALKLIQDAIWPILLGLGAWALKMLPTAVSQFLRTLRAEQLLKRAVDYGLNATAGAVKDKVLTVDVGSRVIAAAANYAIQQGSSGLIDWMGGLTAIKQMILARLPLDENVTATAVGVTPVPLAAAKK